MKKKNGCLVAYIQHIIVLKYYNFVPQYEQNTADSFTFAVPQLGQ